MSFSDIVHIRTCQVLPKSVIHLSNFINLTNSTGWEAQFLSDHFRDKWDNTETIIEWKHEPNHQSCTRNIGVTSLHHSPTRIKSFIFAPYINGRDESSKSEFLIGDASSNRTTAMLIDTNILLHSKEKYNRHQRLFSNNYGYPTNKIKCKVTKFMPILA